jgi:DNA/RNA endonuclease G (NUC1)
MLTTNFMKKNFVLSVALILSSFVKAQVEVPNTENCKLFKKGTFNYCLDTETYKVLWTSTIMDGTNIKNQTYIPPDKEFFKDIPQQISSTWVNIENQVKFWSIEFDSLYVITGIINIEVDSLTPPKMAFYKAILKGCQGDAIGFLVKESEGGKDIKEYTLPIDELEKITGIDFFQTLDLSLQEIIESQFNDKFWPITDFTDPMFR